MRSEESRPNGRAWCWHSPSDEPVFPSVAAAQGLNIIRSEQPAANDGARFWLSLPVLAD